MAIGRANPQGVKVRRRYRYKGGVVKVTRRISEDQVEAKDLHTGKNRKCKESELGPEVPEVQADVILAQLDSVERMAEYRNYLRS